MTKIILSDTDQAFPDSPNAGPDCLCSRCGKAIIDDDDVFMMCPIRVWTDYIPLKVWNINKKIDLKDVVKPQPHEESNLKSTTWEYRYHPACQGMVIA